MKQRPLTSRYVKEYLETKYAVTGLRARRTSQGVCVKDKSEELWGALTSAEAETLKIEILGSQDFRVRYCSPIIDNFLYGIRSGAGTKGDDMSGKRNLVRMSVVGSRRGNELKKPLTNQIGPEMSAEWF